MNVGVSTIGDMFGQTAGAPSSLPKPDAPRKAAQSPLAPEERQSPPDTTQQATSHRDSSDIRREPTNEGRKDFDEVIRKKTKPENTQETPKSGKPTEQDSKASTADQPDAVQTWLAQHSVAVEHAANATAAKIEPKAGRQAAQTIAEPETTKSLPVTGESQKSAGLELLLAAAKKQSAAKAATPEATANTVALNTQAKKGDNATAEMPATDSPVVDTKGIAKEANTKELMPEVPVDASAKTTSAVTEPAIAETLAAANTPKHPSNAKTSMDESPVDGNTKTANAGEKNAIATDTPATTQVKTPETKAQVATIAPEEALPTAEIATNAGAAQTASNTPSLSGRKSLHNSNNAANSSSVQKLNAAAIQTATGQTEGGDGSGLNSSLHSGSEQMLSQTPPESPIAGQVSTFTVDAAKTAAPPEPILSVDSSPSVGEQILESVRSSLSSQTGDKQITIQLNPPELGKVSVKLQEQDGQLTGILEVSKAQTRLEIEQALPQIIRNLANSGVEVKRLEVVLNEDGQSGQQAFKDPLAQDGSFQQRGSTNSGSSGNEHETAGTYYGPNGKSGYQGTAELQEMLVRDDSINILV